MAAPAFGPGAHTSYSRHACRPTARDAPPAQHRPMPQINMVPPLPHWRASLVCLLLLGLLMHFFQVLDRGARQAALRREATALQTAALWRCKALHERRLREHCLQDLKTVVTDITALGARNQLTVVSLERLGP